jgi:protein CWC15
MTTAHRPTWAPAKGGEEQGGMRFFAPSKMVSSKDLVSHRELKGRQEGQGTAGELLRKDLRAELEEKERAHYLKSNPTTFDAERADDLRLLEAAPAAAAAAGGAPDAGGAPRLVPRAADADDEDDDGGGGGASSSEDESEDEEAELLAELARIKRERAEDAARRAAEEAAAAQGAADGELLGGNPLLQERLAAGGDAAADASFTVKRRWDDDVVFRNQARGEPKAVRRFINDTVRSDFHRRFLDRYMK